MNYYDSNDEKVGMLLMYGVKKCNDRCGSVSTEISKSQAYFHFLFHFLQNESALIVGRVGSEYTNKTTTYVCGSSKMGSHPIFIEITDNI
jgi:hypothetical protein